MKLLRDFPDLASKVDDDYDNHNLYLRRVDESNSFVRSRGKKVLWPRISPYTHIYKGQQLNYKV